MNLLHKTEELSRFENELFLLIIEYMSRTDSRVAFREDPHSSSAMIQSRSQSMPVRGLGSGMTREQAYSGNEIGMHINFADTT